LTKQSNSKIPKVVILGGGPAGVTAALSLARSGKAAVTLLERADTVGGNSGSFQLDGIWCDHGSHRLHPVAEPRVLDEIKSVLGQDLLLRPRHGRIRLQKRWIHFPLKPVDLLLKLPKSFTASLLLDSAAKMLNGKPAGEENFATVLRRGLGATICDSFYYPYVEKLWGIPPTELAVTLAKRRVSGGSVSKILAKVARQIPGLKSEISGRFYYPRQGFGQICQGLRDSAAAHGADFVFNAEVTGIHSQNGRVSSVEYRRNGQVERLDADAVWSTLPMSMIVNMIQPPPPRDVLEASRKVRFRGMILIYLVLEQDQFTEFDAHYFPELSIPISRMSEPKNYSASREPRGRTILCAELPSDPGEDNWKLSDQEIGRKFCGWLESVGLPVRARVEKVVTRKLKFAYPVYNRDYEAHFNVVDQWLSGVPGLLTFGRQGLFAHDNTHHAMAMAYAATDCFDVTGRFDAHRWAQHREEFKTHVVED
jgi:protoporphyrinogen oxidase